MLGDCEACIFCEVVAVAVALIVFAELPVLFGDGGLVGAHHRAEQRRSSRLLGRGASRAVAKQG